MIRKGTRVIVLDAKPEVRGVVLKHINWDRTYYRVRLDDGREITSERVRREE